MREPTTLNIGIRLVVGLLLLLPAPLVYAEELQTLTPVADSFVDQASPNQNNAFSADLRVFSVASENSRAIARFDLSSIVSTAAVKTSIFKLWLKTLSANRNHGAYRVTGSPQWTETGVTWNSRDGATNWTTPGGDVNPTAADLRPTGPVAGVTVSWTIRSDGTVTNIPQGWLDGSVPNLGLIVKDNAESAIPAQEVEYGSREQVTASRRPQLDVHFLRDVTLGAATPGISEVTWSWTFPTGSTAANYDGVLFAKKLGPGASFVFSPGDGTSYAVGDDLGNGESVAINTTSFATVSAVDENGADSVVLPGTPYTYKAFTHDATTITGAATPAPPHYAFGVSSGTTTLTGGGTQKNWSYKTGAATLAAPGLIVGSTVVTGSNDGKVHSMSSATGERNYRPVAPLGTTGGAIQSRPPVVPAAMSSTGVNLAYVGSDDGKVYAFNVLTGVKLWEAPVALVGGSIQGATAVQLSGFSNAGFTHTVDLVIAGTRNVGAGSTGNNRVVALNGNTGVEVWSFQPSNMDIINSTPSVDYASNAVWVTSRSGGNLQPSLWKLDSNTGVLLDSFFVGDVDSSPTLNADGKVVYVLTTNGTLFAVRTDIPNCSLATNVGTGPGVGFPIPVSAGANADDIFFSTTTVNKVRFTYAAASCSGTFTTPAVGWTNPSLAAPSTPVVLPPPLAPLSSLFAGSSDGRLYKIDPSTGAILDSRVVNLSATVGDPSFDVLTQKLLVGDTSARIYSFDWF
ncbi:MAG: DNRLRE domain-containing protein [Terriglobia bacterium]